MPDLETERAALALLDELLAQPEADREAFLRARTEGRPALRDRISVLLGINAEALGTGAATDNLEEEKSPERIGAYRIVGRIGRGGMGSVYRGERMTGDFAHVAAIKVIKPGLLSQALVERFRQERQTLAALIHPNIAILHDGGETEEGSPYFAMEYIDGLPLLDWVARHQPSRATRQRLFADICAAVAFAHRALVVHRDLTPSNVLVTRDGLAKLIDFGIARPAEDGSGAAADAGRPSISGLSLTPGYAAPERLTSNVVTTAADIYSLGKLLEKLLPPDGDRELEAIIARATAPAPADRYPTADALGADVAAWHEGYPVQAIGRRRFYAARKYVGRHRLGAAATALGIALLIGAIVALVLSNDREQRARTEAEQRFAQTRAIAHSLLFDIYDQMNEVPGSTRARERLARTGLAYLETLASDRGAPLDVRIEVGRGYLRLAQVVGGGLSGQLGRYQDANGLLARADEILAALARDHPDSEAARQALAALRIEQSGVNLYNNNEVDLARRQAREARQLMQPSPAASLETARLNADALRAEGDTWLWAEDLRRARTTFQAAETFIGGLPPAMQRDPLMQSIRAANLRYLGEAYHNLREPEPARRALDRAVALNQAVLATRPDDPLFRRRVATSLRYRAIVHRADGRHELARQSIEQARVEAMRLRDRDASDVGALQLFAVVSEVYMQVLSDLGRHAEAYRIGDEIRAAYRIMVGRAGNAPGQVRSLAMALRSEGEIHYNGGDHAGACRAWREVADILAGLERRGALTDFDRNNAQRRTRELLQRSCDPPRAGVGRTVPA